MATGFGGGIGLKGSLCGALTGSIMVIGLKSGRTDPKDRQTVLALYETCRKYWDLFQKELGSTECRQLTGCDLSDPDEHKKWADAGGRERCAEIVSKTAKLLGSFLE